MSLLDDEAFRYRLLHSLKSRRQNALLTIRATPS